jgi:hypothetical protein
MLRALSQKTSLSSKEPLIKTPPEAPVSDMLVALNSLITITFTSN